MLVQHVHQRRYATCLAVLREQKHRVDNLPVAADAQYLGQQALAFLPALLKERPGGVNIARRAAVKQCHKMRSAICHHSSSHKSAPDRIRSSWPENVL